VSLDLAFDDAQLSIVDAVGQFCRERCPEEVVKGGVGVFHVDLWKELAELGVLALATPEGDGGALEMVAALEALGGAVFPGPLPATFMATQLLDGDDRTAVARGEAVVSVGSPPLMPFAPVAHLFVELGEDTQAWLAAPRGEIEPVETLAGEPWGRVELQRTRALGPCDRAVALYDVAAAAYLAAAANRLLEATAEHVKTRKQFGRAIGEFQAVAHPLADCSMNVGASTALARAAAFHFDQGDAATRVAAAGARLSASRSAVDTAHVCHQLFGAIGITLEGEVWHVTRRIRQLASQAPGEAHARDLVLEAFGL